MLALPLPIFCHGSACLLSWQHSFLVFEMSSPHVPIILNVDDDESARYAVSRILRAEGYQVWEAGTGETALRLAQDCPDLIVLDVRLPGIDGYEVCRRLKEDPATRAILILHRSAHFTAGEHRVYGLETGADGYLVDSGDPRELVATVKSLLRLQQSERERRQADDQLRAVMEHMPAVLWTTDSELRLTSAMGAGLRAIPVALATVLGHTLHEIFGASDRGREAVEAHRRALEGISATYEHSLHGRSYQVRVGPQRDETGAVQGTISTALDITDRKQVEDFKSALLLSVSHDLRAPLATLTAAVSNLKRSAQEDRLDREALADVDHESRTLSNLVTNLLDLSRLEAGVWKPNPVPHDFGDILGAVLARLDPTLSDRVQLFLPEALPLVMVDAPQVGQILWNLLDNAFRYSAEDAPVEVSAAIGEALTVVVRDRGPGIPPGERENIFHRFHRLGDTGDSGTGIGVGLAVCRALVEAQGGRIWVENAEGAGSRFCFTLPRAPEEEG